MSQSPFVGPAILALADDVSSCRADLVAGLEAAGIRQPDPDWMARFHRHVDLAVRQGVDEDDDDLAVGEFMLWLGHQLHLGHGMLVELAFVRAHPGLFSALDGRGLVRVVQLTASPEQVLPSFAFLAVDTAAVHADPGAWVRWELLDRLDSASPPVTAE